MKVIWAFHLVREQGNAGCTLADTPPVAAARCAEGGGSSLPPKTFVTEAVPTTAAAAKITPERLTNS
jgi:hypothetical protein